MIGVASRAGAYLITAELSQQKVVGCVGFAQFSDRGKQCALKTQIKLGIALERVENRILVSEAILALVLALT